MNPVDYFTNTITDSAGKTYDMHSKLLNNDSFTMSLFDEHTAYLYSYTIDPEITELKQYISIVDLFTLLKNYYTDMDFSDDDILDNEKIKHKIYVKFETPFTKSMLTHPRLIITVLNKQHGFHQRNIDFNLVTLKTQ
jgi:hypothetical protein